MDTSPWASVRSASEGRADVRSASEGRADFCGLIRWRSLLVSFSGGTIYAGKV